MTPEQWRQVSLVFHGALGREPAACDTFVVEACRGDAEVRAEVERLLAAHAAAGGFGDVSYTAEAGGELPAGVSEPKSVGASRADASAGSRPTGRRHPFSWVVWVAALVSAAMFTYAAARLVRDGGAAAEFGWREVRQDGQWFVASVDDAGAAAGRLQQDDRIISFDGMPMLGLAGTRIYRLASTAGQIYRLEIDREGERREISLSVGEGPSALATRLTYFTACLLWCVIGLFIGWARPEYAPARLAFGASVTTGLGFLSAAVLQNLPVFHPMHVVLGYHFFSRFATGAPTAGPWRWILVAMYGIGIVPFAIGLWLHVTLATQGLQGVADLMTAHAMLFVVRPTIATRLFQASLVLMVIAVVRSYGQLADEDQRRRLRWVAYGSTIALTPQILLTVAGFAGRPGGAGVWTFANVFTVLIPLVVAYAVVRHRVFDIKVVVRRTVQYLLARRVLQGAAAVPVVALVYTAATHRHLTIAELTAESQAYLFWIAAIGVVLRYRRPIELALDRRFFREEHDREQLLLGMLDEVGRVESIGELSRLISSRLLAVLHPTRAYVWYRDPDEQAMSSSSDPSITPPDVPSGIGWLAWLESRGGLVEMPPPSDAGLSSRESRWFADHSITLIVPVTDSEHRLSGALLLGAKQSEEPYTTADRRLLHAMATQAAVVRETLRLRARVSQEVRVRHDVLARLDSRLPDLLKECPACAACYDGPAEQCEHDGAALTLSLPVSRTLDRKYRLDRVIAKGGMGAVYEARDLRLARDVAVKIMLSRAFGQEAALRRFRREARAAARLSHPNVVAVYDFGMLEGEGAYLVMERVCGVTLRAELSRQPAMPPSLAAEWFGPLLGGLAAAHAAGIIHRDLKPENVMGRRDAGGVLHVKLLDLGLAKLRADEMGASATMTAEGVVMGTPGYMSPEQLAGREVDERTDIFAIGVMLREALTGARPTWTAHAQAAMEPISSIAGASEGRSLADLLRRCLAADPRDRIASAALLRDELMPLLGASAPADS